MGFIYASKRSKPKTLKALERIEHDLEAARIERRILIGRARAAGATWAEIGRALGMSPSGASSLVRPKAETKPLEQAETKTPEPVANLENLG